MILPVNIPIKTIRLEDLLNILTALALAGGCDNRTLSIVAHAVGLNADFTDDQPTCLIISYPHLEVKQ